MACLQQAVVPFLEPVLGKDVKAYRSKLTTKFARWEKGVNKAPLLQWAVVVVTVDVDRFTGPSVCGFNPIK